MQGNVWTDRCSFSDAIDERLRISWILKANELFHAGGGMGPPSWFLWLAYDVLEACLEQNRQYLCNCKQILYSPDNLYRERVLYSFSWNQDLASQLWDSPLRLWSVHHGLGASSLYGSKDNAVNYCWYLHGGGGRAGRVVGDRPRCGLLGSRLLNFCHLQLAQSWSSHILCSFYETKGNIKFDG